MAIRNYHFSAKFSINWQTIYLRSFITKVFSFTYLSHPPSCTSDYIIRWPEPVRPMVAQFYYSCSGMFSRLPGLTNANLWIPQKGVGNFSFESRHYLFNATLLLYHIFKVLNCPLIDRRSNYTLWSRGFPILVIESTAAEEAAAVPNPVGGFVRWVRWCDALPRYTAVEGTFRSPRISKLNKRWPTTLWII